MGSSDLPNIPKRSMSMVERGSRLAALHLRLLSVLQLAAGAGYIALAVVLQFPPGDPLTLGLWAIGCLAIVTAVCGCFGGCRVRCCLGIYVVLAVLALAGQLGFVLYLFIAPDNAEKQLSDYQQTKSGSIKDNLHEIIITGRWVLLGLLGAQVLAIALAACLRCCTRNRSYEEFQEEEQAQYDARRLAAADHMDHLRAKLGLAEAQVPAAGDTKKLINIHAVSGSAAEQQQQRAMRSSLFQRDEEHRVEGDVEAGSMISSQVGVVVMPSPVLPATSAWPQTSTPTAQPSFKPSWSKAGKQ
ncbi:hypothetical protein ACK3TF_004438 [Chlorella vulgaris]